MRPFFRMKAILLALLLANGLAAQDGHQHRLRADQLYKAENFPEAELNYRRSVEAEASPKGSFNLGNATYRQERYEEAVNQYKAAAESASDEATRAKAFHNLGNAHFQAGQYKESVDAFKSALRLSPTDIGTKQNLSMALRKLPPPQPNDENQQNQMGGESDKQEEQEQQQQDQPQQQDQENTSDSQNSEDQSQQDQSQQQPNEQPSNLSKEEAAKLLEIMDQEEQKVQEKLRKAQSKGAKPLKDW